MAAYHNRAREQRRQNPNYDQIQRQRRQIELVSMDTITEVYRSAMEESYEPMDSFQESSDLMTDELDDTQTSVRKASNVSIDNINVQIIDDIDNDVDSNNRFRSSLIDSTVSPTKNNQDARNGENNPMPINKSIIEGDG